MPKVRKWPELTPRQRTGTKAWTSVSCSVATSLPPGPVRRFQNALYEAAPNPFNPRTTFQFDLAQEGPVNIRVYDLKG